MDEKKKYKQWIVIGTIVAVILIIVLSSVKKSREEGRLKANCDLVAEVFGDSIENRLRNKGVNESAAPANAKSYIIFRLDSSGNVINYFTRGINASKEWTKEELSSVDCIVFAFYDIDTHTYNETSNGRATGRTSRVTTDKYKTYYYNPAEDAVFKAETLNSGGLPSQTTNPKSTRVTDSALIGSVRSALGIFYIPASAYACAAAVAVVCGVTAVFIFFSVKRIKAKREQ